MPSKLPGKYNYNFIDLFAGAGGLSEGFIQAGFNPIAHVEMNSFAAQTLVTRSAYYYLKQTKQMDVYYRYLRGEITRDSFLEFIPNHISQTVICETMSNDSLPRVFKNIDGIMMTWNMQSVDVIVGGPPCQAYSLVGRAQSSHMEIPMKDDPRNYLYKLYARFLRKYQPRMFVFENVTGIKSAQGGTIWKNLQEDLKHVGYEIDCREQNAQTFGVLQNRRRMVIVGWLKNTGLAYPDFKVKNTNAVVNDLFTDLPELRPGESNNTYSKIKPSRYVIENGIRTMDDVLTLQNCRPNIERDINIYKRAIELWNDGHKRLNYNDLPQELKTHKNRHSFTDRFKVVEGDEHCCHTILAHLSKDGHYFIHPDIRQHRSITVREAARIQSFPDSYYFEGPRTSQFVQIGNAVPPLMARGIAEGIFAKLHREDADVQQ
ncbi:DNA cytosine methyltransferase [Jonquetella sp. BV3C21]|uniref:DNA cytosine methyltransferase n=1 Tax=Jonquetella sp. BV3C21 TaxID=1111126 RepID=UPI0003AD860E|nr:DNA cytosine methyltransferase [Jonquetella sp. BV3C21]ERL23633.1 DNA (cytosine-5-)-methyltransferase [Jonquetella sp. BV3C21]